MGRTTVEDAWACAKDTLCIDFITDSHTCNSKDFLVTKKDIELDLLTDDIEIGKTSLLWQCFMLNRYYNFCNTITLAMYWSASEPNKSPLTVFLMLDQAVLHENEKPHRKSKLVVIYPYNIVANELAYCKKLLTSSSKNWSSILTAQGFTSNQLESKLFLWVSKPKWPQLTQASKFV